MQKRDRDGFDPVINEMPQRRADRIEVERRDDAAVAIEALGDLQPMPAGDQRFWEAEEQIVDVVALLGAHLEVVAETLRGEQTEPCAAPLDDRIGDERRAVNDLADIRGGDAGLGRKDAKAFERRYRRILRRRQTFVERDAALLVIIENKVCESPADIEADTVSFHHNGLIRLFGVL